VELVEGMLFAELVEVMLFVELTNVVGDWLWHSDRTDNRSELGHDLLGVLLAERARGRT
jgi:hypothetical protein